MCMSGRLPSASAIRMTPTRGNGAAVFIRARASRRTSVRHHRDVQTSPRRFRNAHGMCSYRTAPRPIFRHGANSGIGRPRSIGASIEASECHRTGSHRVRPPVADRGWKRRFDDPIPLPRGRQLVTLKDAAAYIMKLTKAEQHLEEWQTVTEALMMAAEDRGPLMHARIGVLRALNRNIERVFTDRKDLHWGKRKLKSVRDCRTCRHSF